MPPSSLAELHARLEGPDGLVVAGVLSGTSADGIDVALARCRSAGGELRPLEPLAARTLPLPAEVGACVRAVLDGEALLLGALACLHRDLGLAFGRAAREVAEAAALPLDLIGSHGQTVWHHDDVEPSGPATLQLGDGDHVAAAAGAPVISDFRQADIAAGGGGAPLSAYADDLVFHAAPEPRCILNLGGMGNLTWLAGEEALAFDTGPAGALLDGLARRLLDRPYDEGGAAARGGTPDRALVDELARHPFFSLSPPRSTGRDTFGEPWVAEVAARGASRGLGDGDLLASAVELVAWSVADAVQRHLPGRPETLWVAGGGVHHVGLMAALERRLGCPVRSSAGLGVDPDAREGLVFAGLAARFVAGEGVTRPSVTGARPGRVLGRLSPAPTP